MKGNQIILGRGATSITSPGRAVTVPNEPPTPSLPENEIAEILNGPIVGIAAENLPLWEFVNQLRKQIPHYDLRHLVPPGLTGWAQVRYRYGASVQDAQRKLAFDLYYVRRYSPGFDLAICLRTVVAMAKGSR